MQRNQATLVPRCASRRKCKIHVWGLPQFKIRFSKRARNWAQSLPNWLTISLLISRTWTTSKVFHGILLQLDWKKSPRWALLVLKGGIKSSETNSIWKGLTQIDLELLGTEKLGHSASKNWGHLERRCPTWNFERSYLIAIGKWNDKGNKWKWINEKQL